MLLELALAGAELHTKSGAAATQLTMRSRVGSAMAAMKAAVADAVTDQSSREFTRSPPADVRSGPARSSRA